MKLSNYDRIPVSDKKIKLTVTSSNPTALTDGFSLEDTRKMVEKRLTYEGFVMDSTGQEIVVDVQKFDYSGMARATVNSGRLGSGLHGAGVSAPIALVAGIVGSVISAGNEAGKTVKTAALEFSISSPSKNYTTDVDLVDKMKPYDGGNGNLYRAYEKVAQVVYELLGGKAK